MPRWAPDSAKIAKGEVLGRRLFPRPALAGATDQRPVPTFHLSNFEDSRDGEVSLDRLGRSSAEKQVINYLTPRAEAAADRFAPKRIFNGWACIQAKILLENRKLPMDLVPSPIVGTSPQSGKEDMTENVYHTHTRPHGEFEPYFLALHLQSQFEKYNKIEYSPNDPQKPSRLRIALQRLSKVINRLSEQV